MRKWFGVVAVLAAMVVVAGAAKGEDLSILLERGIHQQETAGDLDGTRAAVCPERDAPDRVRCRRRGESSRENGALRCGWIGHDWILTASDDECRDQDCPDRG